MSLFRHEHVTLGRDSAINATDGPQVTSDKKIQFIQIVRHIVPATSGSGTIVALPKNLRTEGQYRVCNALVTVGTVSSAGATLDIVKAADATAIGSGTSILNATLNVNTAVAATATALNVKTDGTELVATGSRLGWVLNTTATALADCCITLYLERV